MPRASGEDPLHTAPIKQRHSFTLAGSAEAETSQHEASTAMSIRHLPDDVTSKIKSSVVITSLNGVVCGLIANSLDAGATKVNISVDYSRGNCTVEDNGSGILPDEFQEDGGIGKLHHTSRFPPRSTLHGKHGDFLVSLADLSLLSVTSRHHKHVSHNSILIHQSQVLSRHRPSPPEQRLVNFDHGTRVTVRDLFGSLPVRVKQRATLSERSALDKEWTTLVRDVVALLLAWPTGISVSLRESVTGRELNLRPSKQVGSVVRISRLLSQASFADAGDVDSWIPISASSGPVEIQGGIYANPVATRGSQFISLGIHPVPNDYGTSVLYEEINKIFSNSSFGLTEGEDDQGELRGRKSIERWPMFYLNTILTTWADTSNVEEKLYSRGKDLAAILDLLQAVCYRFLKKHNFRPRRVPSSTAESVFSTARTLGGRSRKTQTPSSRSSRSGSTPRSLTPTGLLSRSNSPFDGWDRIKVGKATLRRPDTKPPASEQQTQQPRQEPLIGPGGSLLRKPFEEPSPEPEDEARIRPRSSEVAVLSGSPYPSKRSLDEPELPAEKCKKLNIEPTSQRSEWLQNVLKAWVNPVFETAEPKVAQVHDDAGGTPGGNKVSSCGGGVHFGASTQFASMDLCGRISKEALTYATVISQVDRKFILVKLPLEHLSPASSGDAPVSTLIMLDQHAVDERCRLEDLMQGYFSLDTNSNKLVVDIETLERPLIFEVPAKESLLLDKYQDHFAAWGIVYHRESQKGKIMVTGLPPSILERCRLEPRLLIEMLRKEAWRIVDEGLPKRLQSAQLGSEKAWISNFRGCPQGILEMLYSRSCRSALMFNDILTREACEDLLSRLAKCAFPFQCAHGRPSMAPLVDLGSKGGFGGWAEGRRQRMNWKKWLK